MKHLIATLLLVLAALVSLSQNVLRERADAAFHAYAYKAAAERYEMLVQRGQDEYAVVRNLAFSYWMLRDFEQAEVYAGRAASMMMDPLDQLLYAQALKANRKYSMSLEALAKYTIAKPQDSRSLQPHETTGFYHSLLAGDPQVELIGLPQNTEHSDFGAALTSDGTLIFASARRANMAVRRTYAWDESAFLELFEAPSTGPHSWENAKPVGAPFNTKFHEASWAPAPDGSQVAFTRNTHSGQKATASRAGMTHLSIFFSPAKGRKWGSPEPFRHNNTEWNTGHPAFTPDGTTLYFVSDRPGGYGGTDLYRSKWIQGTWTQPVNLGPQINTPGDELFPWIADDGQLFFASDGWPGLGGLDVFALEQDENGWIPVNLGAPFNSSADDFAFSAAADGQSGFVSSNRSGGQGSDDIYRFIRLPETAPMLAGTVISLADGSPLPGAKVQVVGPDGQPTAEGLAGPQGRFAFAVDVAQGPLHVHVENGAAWTTFDDHQVPWPPLGDTQDMGMCPLSPHAQVAEGQLVDAHSRAPLAGTTITLTDVAYGTPQTYVTSPQGGYQVHLSPGRVYQVRMEHPGYFTRVEEFTAPEGAFNLDQMVRGDMQAYQVGTAIELKNIHYDFDQHSIRPDAARELDKLVKILRDNPSMRVELASHTDARGDDGYNLHLSERRAHAAVDYLIARGIDGTRLQWRGYGETRLRNGCQNGTSCPDRVHEENRRTEFTVLASN